MYNMQINDIENYLAFKQKIDKLKKENAKFKIIFPRQVKTAPIVLIIEK